MNLGKIVEDSYVKYVNFSKAVLWRDKMISIHKEVAENWLTDKIKRVVFVDTEKREKWEADTPKVKENWTLKTVGQEEQYYVPVDIFKVIKFH